MADDSDQKFLVEYDSKKIANKRDWYDNLKRIADEKVETMKSDFEQKGWIPMVNNKKRKKNDSTSTEPEKVPGNLTLTLFSKYANMYCQDKFGVDIHIVNIFVL